MSTILKALDRLERDREGQQGEVPLREEVASEPAPRRGSSLKLFALIAICGGATGAVVAALVMGDGGRPSPRPPVSPVASAPRAVTPEPLNARRSPVSPQVGVSTVSARTAESQERPDLAGTADPGSSAPSRVDVAANEPDPVAEVPSNVVYGSADLPVAALQSEVARIDRPVAPPVREAEPLRVTAPTPRREVEPRTAEPLERVAPAASASPVASVAPPPVPSIGSAAATPDVRVARTVWHPTPSRRYALVGVAGADEPIRVREGDMVGSAVVSEIDPAGVVFLRDEVEFYRRVSASR